MFGFGNRLSRALASIQAAGEDFSADVTKRDDLKRAVWLGVSVAFADGEYEKAENDSIANIAKALYKNFERSEILDVISDAVAGHSALNELGFQETDSLLEGIESVKEAKAIFALGYAIAKADGNVDPEDAELLERFARSAGYTTRELGLKL